MIRNELIYDGSGKPPVPGDVGIRGDRVVAVGKLPDAQATTVIDAQGKAVAPGFINVLSHTGTFPGRAIWGPGKKLQGNR